MVRRIFTFSLSIILLVLLVLFMGYEPLSYYRHLAAGQVRVLINRQPIEALVANPHTDEDLRENLQTVLTIREFARTELSLPADGQFIHYSDMGRSTLVWNVYTAPELSMSPGKWCFPIVGCTVYKGFFEIGKALDLADRLKAEGKDVYVGSAGGYSTLGWFSDPIFQHILDRGKVGVAAYIFHELAHKEIYIKNDTRFNEGFAVAVEQAGVYRWLQSLGEIELFDQYIQRQRKRMEFSALVQTTRSGLFQLYAAPGLTPYEMRSQKELIFEQMKADYQMLKNDWNGYSGFDRWFDKPLNNARLIPFGAYYDHVPAFRNMIRIYGDDMKDFYRRVEQLSQKPREERNRILNEYRSITFSEATPQKHPAG